MELGCLSHMNSHMTLLSMNSRSSVDRAPPCVWEVMGSIPVGDSDFFFVPYLCQVDQFSFHNILCDNQP